jgi:hypothetical protein
MGIAKDWRAPLSFTLHQTEFIFICSSAMDLWHYYTKGGEGDSLRRTFCNCLASVKREARTLHEHHSPESKENEAGWLITILLDYASNAGILLLRNPTNLFINSFHLRHIPSQLENVTGRRTRHFIIPLHKAKTATEPSLVNAISMTLPENWIDCNGWQQDAADVLNEFGVVVLQADGEKESDSTY